MQDRDSWLLGAQARPWLVQAGSAANFTGAALGAAMRAIADTGFVGFETNLACLPTDDPSSFADQRAAAGGLRLAAAHTGGAWCDEAGAGQVEALVGRAPQLAALEAERLVVSIGMPAGEVGAEHLRRLTGNLARLGKAYREEVGIPVAVHNHAPELADDARILRAIVEECAPEDVSLGADLGWAAYAGADVPRFVERFGARLSYLHLRDVLDTKGGPMFVEIGRGRLDYPAILGALASVGFAGWLVVESEPGDRWQGDDDPVEMTRLQYAGLTGYLDAR